MLSPRVQKPFPGPRAQEIIARSKKYEPNSMSDQVPVVWDNAHGCLVQDVDGNVFIDWTSGVLVTNIGHSHPRYVAALQDQAGKLQNCYDFPSEWRTRLAEKLIEITPAHLDK